MTCLATYPQLSNVNVVGAGGIDASGSMARKAAKRFVPADGLPCRFGKGLEWLISLPGCEVETAGMRIIGEKVLQILFLPEPGDKGHSVNSGSQRPLRRDSQFANAIRNGNLKRIAFPKKQEAKAREPRGFILESVK
jgi:hypothetical protein